MIKLETKEFLCVKCPATNTWQMLKDCVSCSGDAVDNCDEEGNYYCRYDELKEERLISYASRLSEEDFWDLVEQIEEMRKCVFNHAKIKKE